MDITESQREELWENAVHEAGHSVACIALGYASNVRGASIVPESASSFARTYASLPQPPHPCPDPQEGLRIVYDAIKILFAGWAAQVTLCDLDDDFHGWDAHGAWGDKEKARDLLLMHGTEPGGGSWLSIRDEEERGVCLELSLMDFQQEALQLICQHQASVERVAKLLREKRTLTGDEIRHAVQGLVSPLPA